MLNITKRALALLLAVVMVFALVGCSKVEDDGSSTEIEYITDIEYIEDESNNDDSTNNQQNNNQQNNNQQNNNQSNNDQGGDQNSYPNSRVNANPEDYRGTKIIFASTVDPKDDGTDYVIENFEKEYGIEVEIIVPSLVNYNAEMTALIAAEKDVPTVGRSNGDAPIYVGYFDSLDKAKLNFKDELWNQNTFKLSTYNGKPYLCDTIGNIWTEIDMVVYSKSLLKAANCPTPVELDAKGEWTFDNYLMIGKETAKLDGCSGVSYDLYDTLLNMGGGSVYRSDANNMMVNGIDSKTTEVIKKVSQAISVDKSLTSPSSFGGAAAGFISKSLSMYTSNLWALRTDGNLSSHPNWNDIGFYYLPAFEKGGEKIVTGIFRGYGIMKKCGEKEAVAGGFFLSEYLDYENYDLKKAFISDEAKNFFFELTTLYAETDNYNPYYTYHGLNEGISGMSNSVVYGAMSAQPAQVDTLLKAAKSNVENACRNLNEYITQQTYGD